MKKKSLFTVLVLISFFIHNSLIAQPWMDCDTIRVYSIVLKKFPIDIEEETFVIEDGLNNFSVQTDIITKSLGISFIEDSEIIAFFDSPNRINNFLTGSMDDFYPDEIKDALEEAKELQADQIIFSTQILSFPNNGILVPVKQAPNRGWYNDVTFNPKYDKAQITKLLGRMTGFSGFDNTVANVFNNTGSMNDTISVVLSDSTINIIQNEYLSYGFAPNEFRDCDGTSNINESGLSEICYINNGESFKFCELTETINYRIINISGMVLKMGDVGVENSVIDFSEFRNGVYFLQLFGPNITQSFGFYKN